MLRTNVIKSLVLAAGLAATGLSASAAGTWAPITNHPPLGVNLMILLTDGSVMCFQNTNTNANGNAIYKLTPNTAGSYQAGTWSTLASMIDNRKFYSTQVLKDGRVFVAGGEYGTGTAHAEIYNPVTNAWTAANPPTSLLDPTQQSPVVSLTQRFYDSNSILLPNGNVLIAPVAPKVSGQPLIYNPTTNTWAAGPNYFRGVYQDEATWAKLPDGTVLTIDPFGTNSERYNPVTNTWINDGNVPVSLYDPFGFELGGAAYLPNGKMFFVGSTGNTALYTPTGTTAPGTWVAGPVVPTARGQPDAPVCMMVDGKVLCAVSPVPTSANHFPPPTTFVEYDYTTNSFANVATPTGGTENYSVYVTQFLQLPNGQVMYSNMTTNAYLYTPAGAAIAAGKPVIQSITDNGGGNFHLTGLGLNGISEGAIYGDDFQMSSNYPIVRLNHSNGNTYYARTTNWSHPGAIATGSTVLSVDYALPAGFPTGSYTITAVANGFASDPATLGPANNSCANATAVSVGSIAGTLVGASNDGTGSCGSSAASPDVWYSYTAPCAGKLMVDTCGSNDANGIDTVVSILTGCGGTEMACNDDAPFGGFRACTNDTGLARDSSVAADLTAGQTVVIRVATFGTSATNTFTLNVAFGAANEDCAHNTPVVPGTYNWTNCASTTDGPIEANCNFCCGDPQVNNDLWWGYHATTDGTMTADTVGSNFDTKIVVYSGSCPVGIANSAIVCSDDFNGTLQSSVSFPVVAGGNYLIRTGGYTTSRGNGVLNIGFFCSADFNQDSVVDLFDYLDFVAAFSGGTSSADFNHDNVVDLFDYLDFVNAFSAGC